MRVCDLFFYFFLQFDETLTKLLPLKNQSKVWVKKHKTIEIPQPLKKKVDK
jgi:hypothetical protein